MTCLIKTSIRNWCVKEKSVRKTIIFICKIVRCEFENIFNLHFAKWGKLMLHFFHFSYEKKCKLRYYVIIFSIRISVSCIIIKNSSGGVPFDPIWRPTSEILMRFGRNFRDLGVLGSQDLCGFFEFLYIVRGVPLPFYEYNIQNGYSKPK